MAGAVLLGVGTKHGADSSWSRVRHEHPRAVPGGPLDI